MKTNKKVCNPFNYVAMRNSVGLRLLIKTWYKNIKFFVILIIGDKMLEAIENRISRRTFDKFSFLKEEINQINSYIETLNKESS